MITPFNAFVRGGDGFLIPYEDKLMWLHNSTFLSYGVTDDDGDGDDDDDDDDHDHDHDDDADVDDDEQQDDTSRKWIGLCQFSLTLTI